MKANEPARKLMSPHIEYQGGFKYQLHSDYRVKLSFAPPKKITTDYISFDPDGVLEIRKGFASDGPSGPTFDTANFMRGAFIHDALYKLIRLGELPMNYRALADKELHSLCLKDGMSRIRAWWIYNALKRGGKTSALPSSMKIIYRAP